jgi:outer membrane protein assembly factor BamB
MRTRSLTSLLKMSVWAWIFALATAATADWPQFRGPGGRGQSDQTGLPTQWDAESNIVWKSDLPGPGASSPVTFGGKIFLTCYTGYGVEEGNPGDARQLKRHLLCLDPRDGKLLWNVVQASAQEEGAYEGFTALHGYASSTPAVDADAVYVFYGATGAAAYSHDGRQLWLTSCGTKTHEWGSANSPVLYENLVIINASIESGALIALDKKTGQEVWRQKGMVESWSTPALVKTGAGWELVVQVKGKILGFDPASGEPLWSCQGIDDYVCPSVIAEGDVAFLIGGRRATAIAVRAGGRGDVTETHKLWEVKKGSNVSSPVVHDGYLYWAHDSRGTVYCVDVKNGKEAYEERLDPRPGRIYASPLAADGKLYYVSRDAGVFVVAAEPQFELLAHNKIASDTSVFNGSPAVADGRLLLRSDKALYCIGK